jgi:phosphoglycerate dehydrogenase-like enzyme
MHVVVRALQATAPIVAKLKELVGDNVVVVNDDRELAVGIAGAELLLITDNVYSAETADILRERAVSLKWIQLLSAGYDAVARHGVPLGVTVTNAGDAYAPAVATHAVALLLGVQRQFPAFLASQARHSWDRTFGSRAAIPFDSTVAIIGFGHIGSAIGRILRSFGARIVAVTRRGLPHPDADETAPVTELGAILPRADAIVIALAPGPDSHHLIGAKEFAAMKRGAVLVNIARGYVVDCLALAEALKNGGIGGAGIDVTDPEPLPEAHPLWDAPNLIISPHMAGASGSVMGRRLAKIAGDNVARWLAGQPLAHRVTL